MHTAMLVGPYDWDDGIIARAEFERRIDKAMKAVVERNLSGVIVYGVPEDNGALAYFTGFTPKLGGSFALLAPGKPERILFRGGAGMAGAAGRLTWIENIASIRDLGKDLTTWMGEVTQPGNLVPRFGFIGGALMTGMMDSQLKRALTGVAELEEIDHVFEMLQQNKSTLERDLIQRAISGQEAATDAFARATTAGAGARGSAIEAERAAFAQGMQDVRVLASMSPGGAPLPLDGIEDRMVDPMLVYLAVRYAGYWAEGLMTITDKPSGAMTRTSAMLDAVLAAARPGIPCAVLVGIAEAQLGPYRRHPALPSCVGRAIGLSRREVSYYSKSNDTVLQESDVYSLQVGAAGQAGDNALASTLIEFVNGYPHVLWRTPV